jgi:hypothetical protein
MAPTASRTARKLSIRASPVTDAGFSVYIFVVQFGLSVVLGSRGSVLLVGSGGWQGQVGDYSGDADW